MLFGAEAYTTVRWIGNENGFAAEETWSKSNVDKEKNTINSNSSGGYTKGFPDGNQWTVPEADARITSGWFWGDSKKTPKTMEELSEMYFRSVGHNAPLLLNVPPNNKGKVDDAILRPGRFDSKVFVNRPDVKGREEILKVHTKNKPLAEDVNLNDIARTTAGIAGADLENLMNESAICAAKDNRAYIVKEDVDKSFIKVGFG